MPDTLESSAVKKAARRVLEDIFPADDEAALIAAVTPDFINHEAPANTPPGPGGAIFYMHALARAFSEQRWTIHNVIAEGDVAVVYCTHSGRHTGPFSDLPPHRSPVRLPPDAHDPRGRRQRSRALGGSR